MDKSKTFTDSLKGKTLFLYNEVQEIVIETEVKSVELISKLSHSRYSIKTQLGEDIKISQIQGEDLIDGSEIPLSYPIEIYDDVIRFISTKKTKQEKEVGVKNEKQKKSTIDKKYTHFAVSNKTSKILNGWETITDTESLKYYAKIDMEDVFEMKPSEYKILSKGHLLKEGIDPFDEKNWQEFSKEKETDLVVENEEIETKKPKSVPRYKHILLDALNWYNLYLSRIKEKLNRLGLNEVIEKSDISEEQRKLTEQIQSVMKTGIADCDIDFCEKIITAYADDVLEELQCIIKIGLPEVREILQKRFDAANETWGAIDDLRPE